VLRRTPESNTITPIGQAALSRARPLYTAFFRSLPEALVDAVLLACFSSWRFLSLSMRAFVTDVQDMVHGRTLKARIGYGALSVLLLLLLLVRLSC
jgi:hypothetical protein